MNIKYIPTQTIINNYIKNNSLFNKQLLFIKLQLLKDKQYNLYKSLNKEFDELSIIIIILCLITFGGFLLCLPFIKNTYKTKQLKKRINKISNEINMLKNIINKEKFYNDTIFS